jgi:PAS domain S-box-containing protein
MALIEYTTSSATKAKQIDLLDSQKTEYVISDGTNIGEPQTLIITAITAGKKSTSYYKAKNSDLFHLWLRYLRRAVGANKAATGKAVIGIDIGLFEDPVCLTDIDGNILDVNDGLCLLLGYEKFELVGQHNTILMPKIVASKHDWYMKNYENSDNSSKKVGCPRICNALHKNGRLIRVQITLGQVDTETGRQYIATMKDDTIPEATTHHRIMESKSKSHEQLIGTRKTDLDNPTASAVLSDDVGSSDASAESPKFPVRTGSPAINSIGIPAINSTGSPIGSPTGSPVTSPIYSRRTSRRKRSLCRSDHQSIDQSAEDLEINHADTVLFDAVDDLLPTIKDALSRANRLNSLKMSQVINGNRKLAQEKNELHQTISELDTEAQRLRITSMIQKRALDSLITFEIDAESDVPPTIRPEERQVFSAMKEIVTDEVEGAIGNVVTFFREETMNSRKIRSVFFVNGASYLLDTLGDAIIYIRSEIDSLEPDILVDVGPDREAGEANVRNAQRFIRRVSRIMNAISASIEAMPPIIRETLIFAKSELDRVKSPDPIQTVTSFLFLRFYVPAIADPESFGLIGSSESIVAMGPGEVRTSVKLQMQMMKRTKCWALIARILQSLANNTPLGHQDPASKEINAYIQRSNRKVKKFMGEVLTRAQL